MSSSDWIIGLLLGSVLIGGIILLTQSRNGVAGSLKTVSPGRTFYQNEESWELVRDKDGFLTNIKVHRNAAES